MKTLNIIMKLNKIAKILSKIVYIACLVGSILCGIGLICLHVIKAPIFVNGVALHGIVEAEANVTAGALMLTTIVGLIVCTAESLTAKRGVKTFEGIAANGTPFGFGPAKDLMRLGITRAAVTLGELTASAIVYAIMEHYYESIAKLNTENYAGFGLGIALILVSLLCRCGAELMGAKKNA